MGGERGEGRGRVEGGRAGFTSLIMQADRHALGVNSGTDMLPLTWDQGPGAEACCRIEEGGGGGGYRELPG